MDIDIKFINMTNPPEKMRLMYDAVAEHIREQGDISTITVSGITKRAGIGKGTAYEYFSSKEELIANALMYEYGMKMQALAHAAFEPDSFKARCYCIMDWIVENRDYNFMFSHIMGTVTEGKPNSAGELECESSEVILGARDYIYDMMDRFMQYGYDEKIFTEENHQKRCLALLSAMVEYAIVVMGPKNSRFGSLDDKEVREFVYKGMVSSLI